jgi:hypothetical protein
LVGEHSKPARFPFAGAGIDDRRRLLTAQLCPDPLERLDPRRSGNLLASISTVSRLMSA